MWTSFPKLAGLVRHIDDRLSLFHRKLLCHKFTSTDLGVRVIYPPHNSLLASSAAVRPAVSPTVCCCANPEIWAYFHWPSCLCMFPAYDFLSLLYEEYLKYLLICTRFNRFTWYIRFTWVPDISPDLYQVWQVYQVLTSLTAWLSASSGLLHCKTIIKYTSHQQVPVLHSRWHRRSHFGEATFLHACVSPAATALEIALTPKSCFSRYVLLIKLRCSHDAPHDVSATLMMHLNSHS